MKNKYCLAIDLGASNGRHMLGSIKDGKLELEEIYRFENGIKNVDGRLVWDTDAIIKNVIEGLRICGELGKIPATVSVDTWGVDYVLLDEGEREIMPVYAYRDSRTDKMPELVHSIVSKEKLFEHTGIQPMSINTVYQLYHDKLSGRLEGAKHFLMMPDYIKYKLTGLMSNEYSIASTSGLVSSKTKEWDTELLESLDLPGDIFFPISMPGTKLGNFSEEVKKAVGFDSLVVHSPGHDTACAVAACPITDKSVYLSSGTWSLIGMENENAILSAEALERGFSNEGGAGGRYTFLESIMGMWLLQSIRKNLNKECTYNEMMEMAMASSFNLTVNPNDKALVAPDSMIEAIRGLLGMPDLPLEDVIKCVYLSLAESYNSAIKTIESLTGKTVDKIIIVGGGSRDIYLNRLTAEICKKKVSTGITEATAIGNILLQVSCLEGITLDNAREIVKNSYAFTEV